MKERICIIDDNLLTIKGVGTFLMHHGFTLSSSSSGHDEIANTLLEEKPDIVIMDMPDSEIMLNTVLIMLKNLAPHSKVIIYTDSYDVDLQHRVKAVGVNGCIHKLEDLNIFLTAINILKKTGFFFPYRKSFKPDNLPGKFDDYILQLLTRREEQTFKLLIEGYSVKMIAEVLGLSNKTVSTYKIKIMLKLKVKNLLSAIDIGRQHLQ